MKTTQKVAFSILISVVLFTGITALAYTGLFDLIEARFYNPSITASISRDNAQNAEAVDKFLVEKQALFYQALKEDTVRRAFLHGRSVDDILARERTIRVLIESVEGIQWIRFVDPWGVRILFSTYAHDILRMDGPVYTYANYNEPYLLYEMLYVGEGGLPKFTFDERAERIIFSFPLYDSFDTYWGTALFSLSVNALANRLIHEGRIRFGQYVSVISYPNGLLFGITAAGESALPSQIASIWAEAGERTTRLFSPLSRNYLALISTRTSHGVFVGRLVNEEVFFLPPAMRIIFLASVFITLFLIIFLLFNFRQEPATVVQNRLKQLQVLLVEQFYELKGEADWTHWMRDLDQRRDEIIVQLKNGLNFTSREESEGVDNIINKSWDELLAVFGGRKGEGIDEEKLQSILKRVLADLTKNQIQHFSHAAGRIAGTGDSDGKPSLLMRAAAIVKELEETEEMEELEEPKDLEEIASEGDSPASEYRSDLSGDDIAYLASKIEFSPDYQESADEEHTIKEDLEIVSPFAGMGLGFSENEEKKTDKSKIIKEMEGVPYINEEAIKTDDEKEAPLNPELKNLVDSVIK